MKQTGRAGAAREREVVARFREHGWVAFRAPASLGVADVVALRYRNVGERGNPLAICDALLIEVKATRGGPYERFQPAARSALSAAAKQAGAEAALVWWPPHKPMQVIYEHDWPEGRERKAA